MTRQSKLFEKTMQELEASLQVQHIATFEPVTCDVHEMANDVLSRYPDFDYFPVLEGDKVVGVLSRRDCDGVSLGQCVGECMQPLNERHLVSADQPLLTFLDDLTEEPYFRLVLKGTGIVAIVTRSDTLNLPVRLLGFALSMQLESIIAALITNASPEEHDWMDTLPSEDRRRVEKDIKKLKQHRENPAAIEATTFDQKIRLFAQLYSLDGTFKDQADMVRDMRNDVSHGHNYAENRQYLEKYLDRLRIARALINDLTKGYLERASNA